jgi:hypothetical protein
VAAVGRAEMPPNDVDCLDAWVCTYRKKYPAVGRYLPGWEGALTF